MQLEIRLMILSFYIFSRSLIHKLFRLSILNIIKLINSPPASLDCFSAYFLATRLTVRFVKEYVIGESHETNILKYFDRLVASQSRERR